MCTLYGDVPFSPVNDLFVSCAWPLTVPSACFALNEKCLCPPSSAPAPLAESVVAACAAVVPRGPERLRPTGGRAWSSHAFPFSRNVV